MTTLAGLSIYNPICSYCWNKKLPLNKPIFFVMRNGEEHWACSEKCSKELHKIFVGKDMKKEKIIKTDYKKSLKRLQEMYLSVWKDTKYGKRIFREVTQS